MERDIQKNGLINLLLLLAAGVATYSVARSAGAQAGQVAAVLMGFGVLVAFVSWFQMRLEERERLEKFELDELARTKGGNTLFAAKDAEAFPAQRAREQFERFFVPGFTVLIFLLQAAAAWYFWRQLDQTLPAPRPERLMISLAAFGGCALALFLFGKFSATMARLQGNRLLRPSASHLLLGAYLCFFAGVGVAGVKVEFLRADLIVARSLCVLLGLLALETLVALILEIYRPRVKGKVARPLYDSRLVGLLGQPEGLITTAAQALDYQFGFKVSETWFYRFFEKALGWLILLQVAVLLVSTSFVFVESGEQALLERFGRPVKGREVLGPGAHLTLPWPMDKVYRYRTDEIQSLVVGLAPDDHKKGGLEEKTILWTIGHGDEDNFLVATREQTTNDPADRKAPPVSLLSVNIPVQFQIHDLVAWAYNHKDAPALLQKISTREVVRYLVSADFNDIMSHQRQEAADTLRERIQATADAKKLGAKILFVGLQGIHPPVKVAGEFEKVVAQTHRKQAAILTAQADAVRTNALALAGAFTATNAAEADRIRIGSLATARAAAFTNQLPAFNAAPSVYLERAYFQTFARAVAESPKYVLLVTNTHDVFQFDLQTKLGETLLRRTAASLNQPPNP